MPLASAGRRLREAWALLREATPDAASRAALLACYAGIARDPMDAREVALTLRCGALRQPMRMRRSDVYTLAEVFHQREYALVTPLPAAPVVVDCGANVGLSALWFLGTYPGATVHCLEPDPDNVRLLRANLGGRPDVHVHPVAAGAAPGRGTLHLSVHGALHALGPAEGDSGATREVAVTDLAGLMATHGIPRIDLLKLDVEGSEFDVVRGLAPRLADVHVITGELHETRVDEAAFYGFLRGHGFREVARHGTNERGVHMFEVARG